MSFFPIWTDRFRTCVYIVISCINNVNMFGGECVFLCYLCKEAVFAYEAVFRKRLLRTTVECHKVWLYSERVRTFLFNHEIDWEYILQNDRLALTQVFVEKT